MKKIFTLFAMVLAFATSGNAKQVLEGSFGPWGETCVVEGNTVTFTKAWSGCGWWLNYINLSDYDCIVVKFAEPTVGDINICAQYGDPTGSVDEDGNPTYAINEAYSTNGVITEGSTIAKVDLNIEHSDLVAQFWIQGTVDNAKCVVSEVYVGTEEEYEADKNAAPKLDYKEVSIAALGSGWGDSTYDSATHTITIGDDWTGKGWWLGGVDYSDFDYFVVEFATATPASGKVMVEAGSAGSGDDGLFDEGCLVKVTPLVEPKNDTKQFYIQGPAGSQYVLAKAYVCTQDYINNNGIADKYEATGIKGLAADTAILNGAIYNLAGQRVNESYKGVVIQNGRKFIQK